MNKIKFKALLKRLKLLVIPLFLITCKNNTTNSPNTSSNTNEISNPSESKNIPKEYSTLSQEDRLKLANARGLTAEKLTFNQLKLKIDQSENILHLYVFWLLDQPESMEFLKHLRKLKDEIGEQNLKLMWVNLDSKEKHGLVNTFIRENGITSEVFVIDDKPSFLRDNLIHATWDGTIPAILFANKSNGTHLFYQQSFSFEELMAIVQPLTI